MGCCAGHKPFIMAATDDDSPLAIARDSHETSSVINEKENQNDAMPGQILELQNGTFNTKEDKGDIQSLVIPQKEERNDVAVVENETEGDGILSRNNRESMEEKQNTRKHLHGPAVRVLEETTVKSGPQREYVPDSDVPEPAQAGRSHPVVQVQHPVAPVSPIHWFPRAKKESFLERKIRLLQEKDGGDLRSLDETLDTAPTKLSLVEREKQAATIAAMTASSARHSALIEASWCRILDAANIPSPSSMEVARLAETRAEDALMAATKLGVVLNDQGDNPGQTRQGLPGGITRKDAILKSVKNIQEVEKEVVMAVTQALRAITEEREIACVKANLHAPEVSEATPSTLLPQDHGLAGMGDEDVPEIENKSTSVDGLPEAISSREGEGEVLDPPNDLEGNEQTTEEEDECQESSMQAGEADGSASQQLEFLVNNTARAESGDSDNSSGEQLSTSTGVARTRRPAWQGVVIEPAAPDDANPAAEATAVDDSCEGLESTECSVGEPESLGPRPVDCCRSSEILRVIEIRKDMPLEEVMLSRIRSLADEQQTSLAAIVATKSLVNDLLEELKDVRKTGVRRSSGGGLGDMVKHVSRLQKEKALAEATRDGETKKKPQAVKVNVGEDLGSVLKKHVSRFERDVLAARERAKVSPEPKRVSKQVQTGVMPGEGLGEVLVKHTSRLQREKKEALISDAASGEKMGMGTGVRHQKSNVDNVQGSLGADFKKGLSRLEREKMAAKANDEDLTPTPDLVKASTGSRHPDTAGLGESMIMRKSTLQREIEAARSETAQLPDNEARESKANSRLANAGSSEGGLDSFVKRKSKLQMEIEKARSEAEVDTGSGSEFSGEKKPAGASQQTSGPEQEETKVLVGKGFKAAVGGTQEWGSLGDNFVPRISKLEMEKQAAAESQRAEDDRKKGQRGSAARLKAPEVDPWGGESLGCSLKHVSRLERDKAAWRKAEEEAQRQKA